MCCLHVLCVHCTCGVCAEGVSSVLCLCAAAVCALWALLAVWVLYTVPVHGPGRLSDGSPWAPVGAPVCPPGQDSTLKLSFLSASIMLVKDLSQESSAWSYKFTQTLELIQCLLVSDPRGLCGDGRLGRQVGASPMLAPTRPPVHPGEGAQLPSQPLPAEDHTGHHGAEVMSLGVQERGQSDL